MYDDALDSAIAQFDTDDTARGAMVLHQSQWRDTSPSLEVLFLTAILRQAVLDATGVGHSTARSDTDWRAVQAEAQAFLRDPVALAPFAEHLGVSVARLQRVLQTYNAAPTKHRRAK